MKKTCDWYICMLCRGPSTAPKVLIKIGEKYAKVCPECLKEWTAGYVRTDGRGGWAEH